MGLLELLYLSRGDVEDVGLTMKEIIDAVEDVFREKDLGRVEIPLNLESTLKGERLHTRHASIHSEIEVGWHKVGQRLPGKL